MSSASKREATALPDLSVCEREPIHIPGSIEPNGALLVIQEPELTIAQVSANTGALLGIEADAMLGVPLPHVLEAESFESIRLLVSSANLDQKRRYLSGMRVREVEGTFDASIHRHQGLLIIEVEPESAKDKKPESELCASLTDAVSALDSPLSLYDLCQRVATAIRHLTHFDRVMLYQFLEDDTGSVIAEDCREDMTPYLGLRYPASDIPAQARRLYLLNTLRLKSDVNAVRVPLVPPLNPVTEQPLDMSHCVLRAMSPVHDEYLKNMGVTASMSVSIVKDNRLWGLIACHHSEPKTVPYQTRVSCEVLARVFSARITAAEEEENRRHAGRVTEFREQLSERLRGSPDIVKALLEEGDRLTSVVSAEGAAVCIGGEVAPIGVTPSPDDITRIVQWLDSNQQQHLFYTDKLSEQCQSAEAFSDIASGLLSSRIALGSGDFILWFRPPAQKVVEWAGNPAKPVQETEAGKRISPRLSFEKWKETVGDRSEPWRDRERDFALALRQIVAEVLLVAKNEEITRLNHELERSNTELSAFAYAASHDLQEPVRTVRAFAQLLRRRTPLDDQARQLVNGIEDGALRMGDLISGLLAYGNVGGGAPRERQPVELEEILRLVTMNLAESIRASEAVITHDVLPTVKADPTQMTQLVQNLVGNSIKYRRADEPPRVHIAASLQDDVWTFAVEDNGEGFKLEEARLIFEAFQRLHGKDVPGTGLGLALCRRIVESHGGRIWAESKGRGHGATFWFTLPHP
jgi:two-component system, chemotaxis family, sensor kinase Cph1